MRPVIAQFVTEVRRRGLLKVATAYLIVIWLVLEIGHTLFVVFDLPHRALQFIFVWPWGFPSCCSGCGRAGLALRQGRARCRPERLTQVLITKARGLRGCSGQSRCSQWPWQLVCGSSA